MSSGTNISETKRHAEDMSYKKATYNCMVAKCVPYKKATKIRLNPMLVELRSLRKQVSDMTNDLRKHDCSTVDELINKTYNTAIADTKNLISEMRLSEISSNGVNILYAISLLER